MKWWRWIGVFDTHDASPMNLNAPNDVTCPDAADASAPRDATRRRVCAHWGLRDALVPRTPGTPQRRRFGIAPTLALRTKAALSNSKGTMPAAPGLIASNRSSTTSDTSCCRFDSPDLRKIALNLAFRGRLAGLAIGRRSRRC